MTNQNPFTQNQNPTAQMHNAQSFSQPHMAYPQMPTVQPNSIDVQEEQLIENGSVGINVHDFSNSLKIMKKLLNVRKEIAYLQKKSGKMFPYVSSGMVVANVKSHLDNNDIFYIPTIKNQKLSTVLENLNGDQRVKYLSTATIDYTFVDIESGESMTYSYAGVGSNLSTPEASVGKLLTYTEKYCLLKTFLIPSDEYDVDVMEQIVDKSTATQTISKEDANLIFESFDKIIENSNNELSLQDIMQKLNITPSEIVTLNAEYVPSLQEAIRSLNKEVKKTYGKNGKGSKELNNKNDEKVAELVAQGQQQKQQSLTPEQPTTEVNEVNENATVTVQEDPLNLISDNNGQHAVNQSQSAIELQPQTQNVVSEPGQQAEQVVTVTPKKESKTKQRIGDNAPVTFTFMDIQRSNKYAGQNCVGIRVEGTNKMILIIGDENIALIESLNEGQQFIAYKFENPHGLDIFTNVELV